jgi:parallel beta-helix repeat protein
MLKKIISGMMLVLLFVSVLTYTLNVKPTNSWTGGTIYIRADGSIDPSDAPVQRNGDLYTLTDNITSNAYGIVIERNNMTLEGAGYTVQGSGLPGTGILLSGRSNVTIKSMQIMGFFLGIEVEGSSDNNIIENRIAENSDNGIEFFSSSNSNNIVGNNVTANDGYGIALFWASDYNNVSDNIVAANTCPGIWLEEHSNNNRISRNNVTANGGYGIGLYQCANNRIVENSIAETKGYGFGIAFLGNSNNIVSGNNVTNNNYGIYLESSSNNTIYGNNFMNNVDQVYQDDSYNNTWDSGYPSGGNHWSDYAGADLYSGPYQNETGSDGIGDTPYTIDADNIDHYPLMNPWAPLPGGTDIVDGAYVLGLEIFGLGVENITLGGPTAIVGGKQGDADHDGLADIETEIVSMRLTGNSTVFGQIETYETPNNASKGLIEELESGTGFPAESFFDVFFEIVIEEENLTLINLDPLRLEAIIYDIPPFGTKYVLTTGSIFLYDKFSPEIVAGKINYFSLNATMPEKEIKLAFHVMPVEDLKKKPEFSGLTDAQVKDKMEKMIDDMLNGVNKIWKPANISFIKSTLTFDAPKTPTDEELRKLWKKEKESWLPVFLVEKFANHTNALGVGAENTGAALSQKGWTDDPNEKNDDNDPNNGWNGETPPDEALGHELGHALGLVPSPRGDKGHYTEDEKRHKLMHKKAPMGIDLNPEDIEDARKSDLAHKYEPTRTDLRGDYIDPRHDALCSVATVDLINASLYLGMGIKVAGNISNPAGDDGYSFVIDTDNNPTTGATDPLLRGGEALASLRYNVGVGWISNLSAYNATTHGWTLIGTFPFEVFNDTRFVFMLVPMDAIGVPEGVLITWKAFTKDRGELADVTGYVIMETTLYLLPEGPLYEPQILTPTADFTFTPTHLKSGEIITFDASSSFHPNSSRTIISYAWDFGDGNFGNGTILPHIYPRKGVYTVNLTIADDSGLQSWATQTLTITFTGDFNGDGKCNILDLVLEATKFGKTVPPEDPKYDINGDGKINLLDLVKVAIHFGETDL